MIDLVVVVNGFPRLSETFVLHELLELERQGARLHVVALRRPEEVVQQEHVERLQAEVEYLPEASPELLNSATKLRVRLAHSALALTRPRAYVNALGEILSSPDFSRTALRRGVLLAHRVLLLGSPPIYVHFANKPATVARFAPWLAGVPYGLCAHAKDIWLTPPAELTRKLRDAEIALTCTAAGRQYLDGLAGGRTLVRLAYHGVDARGFSSARVEGEPPLILSVGMLVPKKGHATLLRAAAILRERGLAFQVQLAGEGPEWSALQRLVHQLGLGDRVEFLGSLTEEELRARYERAQVFALACQELESSDRDGIPNVIPEAKASGLPVASTVCGEVTEAVVDGESGLLSAQGDAEGFAAGLERLVRDAGLRARLGERGRARVAAEFDRAAHLVGTVEALRSAGLLPRGRIHEAAAVEERSRAAA